MKNLILLPLLFIAVSLSAQLKLHSHNDYLQAVPLFTALDARAFSIEADVFLVKGSLLVAHTFKERSSKKTLKTMYIEPIVRLFKKNNGKISADNDYRPNLMIDIKEEGPLVLDEIVKELSPLREFFDRSVNPNAVQVVISGDRGPSSQWKNYPSYIMFDGRPNEEYTSDAIDKIAFISDNYFNYIVTKNNRGDSVKIKALAQKAHGLNKLLRLWGSPDTEDVWKLMDESNVDIINTDKPAACREFFEKWKGRK